MIKKSLRIPREIISFILKKGQEENSKLFIVRYATTEEAFIRYRTIVSKRIHPKAIDRNHLRRQIYEAIRLSTKETTLPKALDLILIPKKRILQASYSEIEDDIKEIILKLPQWTNSTES